jgi:hypothetical protein
MSGNAIPISNEVFFALSAIMMSIYFFIDLSNTKLGANIRALLGVGEDGVLLTNDESKDKENKNRRGRRKTLRAGNDVSVSSSSLDDNSSVVSTTTTNTYTSSRSKKNSQRTRIHTQQLYPVIEGKPSKLYHMDFFVLNRYVPCNYQIDYRQRSKVGSIGQNRISKHVIEFSGASINEVRDSISAKNEEYRVSVTATSSSKVNKMKDEEGIPFDILPEMKDCEYDGENAKEMKKKFPSASKSCIVRFLVARKGNLKNAIKMYTAHEKWRSLNYPLSAKKGLIAALNTNAFSIGGVAKNGTPLIHFRGALYDSTVASAEDYCLAAGHAIESALKNSGQLQVTVISYTGAIKGAKNEPADVNFLKGFVNTLSNNFPERMKNAFLYPFPFFGRVLWGVVRVCMDKRSQDKIKCLAGHSDPTIIPKEILDIVDINEIPTSCNGKSEAPQRPLTDFL